MFVSTRCDAVASGTVSEGVEVDSPPNETEGSASDDVGGAEGAVEGEDVNEVDVVTARVVGGHESASLVGFGVSMVNSKNFGDDTGFEGMSTSDF